MAQHYIDENTLEIFGSKKRDGLIECEIPTDTQVWSVTTKNWVDDSDKVMAKLFYKFTTKTSEYIQAHIDAHNADNSVSFDDINTFPKYAMNPDSVHYIVANKYIVWIDLIWVAVRSLTVEPTDEEFTLMLDAVVF